MASLLLFCAGAHPALQSIAAASVSPIQAGEAIAGVEMVGQIARFTSPIVIGTLQSKYVSGFLREQRADYTVQQEQSSRCRNLCSLLWLYVLGNFPLTMLIIRHQACVFVAAVLTLLIRDEDRYIAKAVVLPQEAEGSPDGQ